LTGGLAADGFDALPEDREIGLKSASVWSYNFNAGLSYRYYVKNSFYLGFRVKPKYHELTNSTGLIKIFIKTYMIRTKLFLEEITSFLQFLQLMYMC